MNSYITLKDNEDDCNGNPAICKISTKKLDTFLLSNDEYILALCIGCKEIINFRRKNILNSLHSRVDKITFKIGPCI